MEKNYDELNKLFKNNEFRKIDENTNARKFYLLRSISKKKTLKDFCLKNQLSEDLNEILANENITYKTISDYIKEYFVAKTDDEMISIKEQLDKMDVFDWGGSAGNNLEKNIVNNVIKKCDIYDEIEEALEQNIKRSVTGYTLNSWYNHWSSILIEEIFNKNPNVIPTISLIEKIDFFIKGVPFDLKVTYFPEELTKNCIADDLYKKYGSKSELTCAKKLSKKLEISIPNQLDSKEQLIYIYNEFNHRDDEIAKSFLNDIKTFRNSVYEYYKQNPNELIKWLYENQGEMRFDAANRFFLVLIDKNNPFDSWKLKRNYPLLEKEINSKINSIDPNNLNKVRFHWHGNDEDYDCYSEILFVEN